MNIAQTSRLLCLLLFFVQFSVRCDSRYIRGKDFITAEEIRYYDGVSGYIQMLHAVATFCGPVCKLLYPYNGCYLVNTEGTAEKQLILTDAVFPLQ